MRRICILLIAYEDNQCILEASITKNHYDKISRYFGLPIQTLIVRYNSDPSMDRDLLTNYELLLNIYNKSFKEYDQDTERKIMDLIQSDAVPESDIYIRVSPSTVLNLPRLNGYLQSDDFKDNMVVCGEMHSSLVTSDQERLMLYPRGNMVCFSRNRLLQMRDFLNSNDHIDILKECCGTNDDHLLGYLLFNILKSDFISTGIVSFLDDTERFQFDNLMSYYCIVCKDYVNRDQSYAIRTIDNICSMYEHQYGVSAYNLQDKIFKRWMISKETILCDLRNKSWSI